MINLCRYNSSLVHFRNWHCRNLCSMSLNKQLEETNSAVNMILFPPSRSEMQRKAHAERERIRRSYFTPEQKRAHAERERRRRATLTEDQRRAHADRERARRASLSAEQRQAHADKERLRRADRTEEQRKAHAERVRMRRKSLISNEQKGLNNQQILHEEFFAEGQRTVDMKFPMDLNMIWHSSLSEEHSCH